jgi:hypothetical protein
MYVGARAQSKAAGGHASLLLPGRCAKIDSRAEWQMNRTAAQESPIMVGRRSMLRVLGVALGCLAGFGDGRIVGALLHADAVGSPPQLTPVHRRLAALGGRLEKADPGAAARLSAFVRGEAIRVGLDAHQVEAADRLCAMLLDATRVRTEFRNGHLQHADGWILARSEAGACVYLHRLFRASAGSA